MVDADFVSYKLSLEMDGVVAAVHFDVWTNSNQHDFDDCEMKKKTEKQKAGGDDVGVFDSVAGSDLDDYFDVDIDCADVDVDDARDDDLHLRFLFCAARARDDSVDTFLFSPLVQKLNTE